MLKYSTYKNLAQLAAQREDLETAMEFYLEVRLWPCSPPFVFLKVFGGGGEVVVLLAEKNLFVYLFVNPHLKLFVH